MQSGFVPSMTALSVPQHKPMCTIAFGGSTRTDDIALGLRRKKSFSLEQREQADTSAALSTTCLSTSVPHSLGTCLETGIYTTGGWKCQFYFYGRGDFSDNGICGLLGVGDSKRLPGHLGHSKGGGTLRGSMGSFEALRKMLGNMLYLSSHTMSRRNPKGDGRKGTGQKMS